MNPRMKTRLTRVLAVVIAAAVALAVAEGTLRLLAPQFRVTSAGMFERDPQRGYRLKAGYRVEGADGPEIRVNSRSHRDDEPDAHADCRIVAIGDSHTFGARVDQKDTYPAQLEALIATITHRHVDVLNAGVPAYGWLEESDVLREFLAGGRPANLLLWQTSWNDVNDNGMGVPKYLIDGNGNLVAHVGRVVPGGFGEWGMKTEPISRVELAALEHSHVATLLIGGWRGARWWLRRGSIDQEIDEYKWKASEEALGAIVDRARSAGLPILAVVHPGDRVEGLERRHEMTDRMIAMLGGRGVETVDLRAAIRREENAGELYIPGNEHFNARGYAWMSRQLLEPVIARLAASSQCVAR